MNARQQGAAWMWGFGLYVLTCLSPAWPFHDLGWRGWLALTLPAFTLVLSGLKPHHRAGVWVLLTHVSAWWLHPDLLRTLLSEGLWSGLWVGLSALCTLRLLTSSTPSARAPLHTLNAAILLAFGLAMGLPVWRFQGEIPSRSAWMLLSFALMWVLLVWAPQQRQRPPRGIAWSLASALGLLTLLGLWHLGETA